MATFPTDISNALHRARKAKNLSQKELSTRTGVPQSHISKIENGNVDIRMSSLKSIANALDLDLALVPKKAMPAVKSIARTTETKPLISRETKHESKALAKITSEISKHLDNSGANRLRREIKNLQQHAELLQTPDTIRQIRLMLEAKKTLDDDPTLQSALKEIEMVRNQLAHSNLENFGTSAPRSAYQLDNDDE